MSESPPNLMPPAADGRAAPVEARGRWMRVIWARPSGRAGIVLLLLIALACFGTLGLTLSARPEPGTAHIGNADRPTSALFEAQDRSARHLPPFWWPVSEKSSAAKRRQAAVENAAVNRLADRLAISPEEVKLKHADEVKRILPKTDGPVAVIGTDVLGRDLLSRLMVGGAVSLSVGLLAAALSVVVGTLYGATAGYVGGKTDALMMRFVDVLYGLPYVLLVVLLAVASGAIIDEYTGRGRAREAFARIGVAEVMRAEREFDRAALGVAGVAARGSAGEAAAATGEAVRERMAADKGLVTMMMGRADGVPGLRRRDVSGGVRMVLELGTLLVAIGGVSWLTMARVVRGQVMSLKSRPFVEAARAIGASRRRIFARHLLPNLRGPIIVYATLTIPQAILQESFLSFLGIGVKPPLPSWGNLAAEGLEQLNLVQSHWWLLVFPCLMLGATLLALNFVGEALRAAMDPRTPGA